MNYHVCVIGLGYVGLTFSVSLARVGLKVLGVEKIPRIVDMIKLGKAHFSEKGLDAVLSEVVRRGFFKAVVQLPEESSSQVYVISVGTPLGDDGNFRVNYIQSASKEVAERMPDGALIILRSTVAIGTARNIVMPILETSGKQFQIAVCPERTLAGGALEELRNLPQVIGSDDDSTRSRAIKFFKTLTKRNILVSSLEAAEVIKLVDNTFRDVQFGFANEVARICESWGLNATEVINQGNIGYPRTNVALPGLVGGPCLSKDPHILAQSCDKLGLSIEITKAARKVNEYQPKETANFIMLEHKRRCQNGDPVVALLGIAFKGVPETDELRGSMSLKVLKELESTAPNSIIRLYDPICSKEQLRLVAPDHDVSAHLDDAISEANIVIIANNHHEFSKLRLSDILKKIAVNGFVYDYWNHFSSISAPELNKDYFSVGNISMKEH